MGIFQLQGRLRGLIQDHIVSNMTLKNNSPLVFVIVVLIHLFLIFIVLNASFTRRGSFSFESSVQLIQLRPERTLALSEPEQPNIDFKTTSINVSASELSFKETLTSTLDLRLPQSDSLYKLPDGTSDQYKDVFDPKLRKKLMEAQVFNIPRKQEKPTSWTDSDGRVFIDMGNGQCLMSMQKMDSRERGTNWGFTRCGKTDSEKMMDNVNADLTARKHSLKTQ